MNIKSGVIIALYCVIAAAIASCVGMSPEQQASAQQAVDHMVQAGVLTGTEGQALKDALNTPWYERLLNGALWVGATYAGIQVAPGMGVKRLIARTVAGALQGAKTPSPEQPGESPSSVAKP